MLVAAALLAIAGCAEKATAPPPARGVAADRGAAPKNDARRGAAPDAAPEAPSPGLGGRTDPDPRVFHRSLGEPELLDPGLIAESEGGKVTHDTFEGLHQHGPSHKEWPLGAASKEDISPDGRTLTYTLRKDGRWSDGQPVTARDFEYAWMRVLDPKNGARYATILFFIDGARAYYEAKDEVARAALREKVGITVVDDQTLVVRLVAPTPFFPQLTAFYTYAPVPRHAVLAHGDQWARPENIVSNGPWKTVEWKVRQHIICEKNPYHRDKDALPFDKLVYHITEDTLPVYALYESGGLDYIEGRIPPALLPRLMKEKHPDLRKSPYLGVYFYMFNVKRKPLDNPRVRHAINMAINKKNIGRYVSKGGQEAADTLVPPMLSELGYQSPEGTTYDPRKARELLAEGGYPDGKGFPSLKLSYNTMEGNKLIAEFVQQELKKNLGITVELENMEWKSLVKKQDDHDFDITRSGWIGDYIDPLTFLEEWTGENPNNDTNWNNARYNQLVERATNTADNAERMALLKQAEEILLEELPVLPLYFYVKFDLVKPWLKGYQPHLQGLHVARWFRVE